jgi:Skp family chaperone for outer membrane proteins
MKIKTCGLILAFFSLGVFVFFIRPQNNNPSFKIAAIDSHRIKTESKLSCELMDFKEKIHKKIYEDILMEEQKLRNDYAKLKISLDPPAVIDKHKIILDQKKLFLEKKIQTIQIKLQDEISKRAKFIEHHLDRIIKEFVRKKNIQIVMNTKIGDKRVVFHVDPSLDITDDVMQELNKVVLPPMNEKEMIK